MKRVWVTVIAALLMITAGCGKTAETQEVSLPEEISTGISVEDQDSVPVDGSSLFQPVKGSEQNMDQQADAEIVDIEEENDQQKEPAAQTDQTSACRPEEIQRRAKSNPRLSDMIRTMFVCAKASQNARTEPTNTAGLRRTEAATRSTLPPSRSCARRNSRKLWTSMTASVLM